MRAFGYRLLGVAAFTYVALSASCVLNTSPGSNAQGEPTAASRIEVASSSQLALSPTPDGFARLTVVAARQTPTSTARPAVAPASAAPTPRPAASPRRPQDALADRVRQAVASLQSGELEATSTYADGTRSRARIEFQFGDLKGPSRTQPAIHHEVVYESPSGSYSFERITWRDKSWQRDGPSANWVPVEEQEGVWGQVQPFLPRLPQAGDPQLENDAPDVQLHWLDRNRNLDLVLRVGGDGVPQEWKQTQLGGGSVVIVKYTGWNTSVRIQPPSL